MKSGNQFIKTIFNTMIIIIMIFLSLSAIQGIANTPKSPISSASANTTEYTLTYFSVCINEIEVSGDINWGSLENPIPIFLRLIRNDSIISTISSDTDNSGYFYVYFTQKILIGDLIEVDLPDSSTYVVEVTSLSVDIDKKNDVIRGQAEPEREIFISVSSQDLGYASLYVETDAAGYFEADFSDIQDILFESLIYVQYTNYQGYSMQMRSLRPDGLRVYSRSNYVVGYAQPGASVDLTLKNAQGSIKATANVQANSNGKFSISFYNPTLVEIDVGDSVEMIYDGAALQIVKTVDIAITSIDHDTEIISGYAPPNSKVSIYVRDLYSGDYFQFLITTDSSGIFSADLSSGLITGVNSPLIKATGEELFDIPFDSNLDEANSLLIRDPHIQSDLFQDNFLLPNQDPLSSKTEKNIEEYNSIAEPSPFDDEIINTQISRESIYFDILPGTYAYPTYHDSNDNEVRGQNLYAGPYAQAYIQDYSYIYVVGEPNASVEATLSNALGAIKGTAEGTILETGTLYFSFYDSAGDFVNLLPGDVVDITLSDGSQHNFSVLNINYVIDRDARIVYGKGPANKPLRLVYLDRATWDVTTANDGLFSLTIGDEIYSLTGGYSFYVYYRPIITQSLVFHQRIPRFTIYPHNDSISGYGTPRQSVVATLKNSYGAIKETQSTITYSDGWYNVYFDSEIITGDIVTMEVGQLVFEQEVVGLTIAGDPINNIVYGMAPSGGWLNVYSSQGFGPYQYSNHKAFRADYSGNFAVSFPQVRGGDNIRVMYWAPGNKDQVEITGIVPTIYFNQERNYLYGYSTPGSSGTISIKSYDEKIKGTQTLTATEPYGYFYYDPDFDIIPGDRVHIEIGDLLLDEQVIPLIGDLNLSSKTLSGVGPKSDIIGYQIHSYMTQYSYYMWFPGYMGFTETNSNGDFSINISEFTDVVLGDYASLYYMTETDAHFLSHIFTTSPSISVTDFPSEVPPNTIFEIEVDISNGVNVGGVYVSWDTESHDENNDYRYGSNWQLGEIGKNLISLNSPSGGKIYFKAHAYIDGRTISSSEYVIDVFESIYTTLYMPVSGTTNNQTPTLMGVSAPNASIILFQDGTEIGIVSADEAGNFSFLITDELPAGSYAFHAIASVEGKPGPKSNVILLTIDPSLVVDPINIKISTEDGQIQHLRDTDGYANLGGMIYTRSGETVHISIPITSQDVQSAEIYVDGEYAATMINSGNDIYVGSFMPPTSGDYRLELRLVIVDGLTRDNLVHILTGYIDPDGYVYDANKGPEHRMAGAIVTCYELKDKDSDTWVFWNGSIFGQKNPQTVGADGYFAFFTLPGDYKITVSAPGYFTFTSPVISVTNKPVYDNVPLWLVQQNFLPLIFHE